MGGMTQVCALIIRHFPVHGIGLYFNKSQIYWWHGTGLCNLNLSYPVHGIGLYLIKSQIRWHGTGLCTQNSSYPVHGIGLYFNKYQIWVAWHMPVHSKFVMSSTWNRSVLN